MTPARVVSVDLALKRARDIGVCVLTRRGRGVEAELVSWSKQLEDGPTPDAVARACVELAESRGARLIALDGPQAWKRADNGLAFARACDRAVHAPAKVGEPGAVLPRPYTGFVTFSIAVFDALDAQGWRRLASSRVGARGRCAEVFPHAAWKRLGLAPLPAKARCSPRTLRAAHAALCCAQRVRTNRTPTHDELQALVAGLAGLALVEAKRNRFALAGEPPRRIDGAWREGFVLLPRT